MKTGIVFAVLTGFTSLVSAHAPALKPTDSPPQESLKSAWLAEKSSKALRPVQTPDVTPLDETKKNKNVYSTLTCQLVPERYDKKRNFDMERGPHAGPSISRPRFGYYRLDCPSLKAVYLTVDYSLGEVVGRNMGRTWDAASSTEPNNPLEIRAAEELSSSFSVEASSPSTEEPSTSSADLPGSSSSSSPALVSRSSGSDYPYEDLFHTPDSHHYKENGLRCVQLEGGSSIIFRAHDASVKEARKKGCHIRSHHYRVLKKGIKVDKFISLFPRDPEEPHQRRSDESMELLLKMDKLNEADQLRKWNEESPTSSDGEPRTYPQPIVTVTADRPPTFVARDLPEPTSATDETPSSTTDSSALRARTIKHGLSRLFPSPTAASTVIVTASEPGTVIITVSESVATTFARHARRDTAEDESASPTTVHDEDDGESSSIGTLRSRNIRHGLDRLSLFPSAAASTVTVMANEPGTMVITVPTSVPTKLVQRHRRETDDKEEEEDDNSLPTSASSAASASGLRARGIRHGLDRLFLLHAATASTVTVTAIEPGTMVITVPTSVPTTLIQRHRRETLDDDDDGDAAQTTVHHDDDEDEKDQPSETASPNAPSMTERTSTATGTESSTAQSAATSSASLLA